MSEKRKMKRSKEPGIAAVLNIIPGLGYIYIGTRKTFASLLLVSSVFAAVTMFDPYYLNMTEADASLTLQDTIFILAGCISFVAGISAFVIDAYKEAKRVNIESGANIEGFRQN